MSLKDKAIVLFKPSRYKSSKVYGFRGGDWTFSRPGAATRYNESGIVQDVATEVPRIDYNVVGDCPMVRLEGGTTNHATYSEDFAGAWSKVNVGINANVATAPDGTQTASRLYNNAGTSVQFLLYRTTNLTIVSGRVYVLSVFVKPEKYFKVCLHLGGSSQQTYDLRNGAAANVIEYPNGWYRVFAVITAGGSSNNTMYISFDDVGYRTESTAEAKTILIWGAQAQEYQLSDYIPATGNSSASTAQDIVSNSSITGLKGTDEYTVFFDLYKINQSFVGTTAQIIGEGSIYSGSIHQYSNVLYYTNSSGASYQIAVLDSSTSYNRVAIRHTGVQGVFKCFINGVLAAEVNHSANFASNQNYDSATFYGGRTVYLGTYYGNEGGLLEYALYKGSLTDEECRYLTLYRTYDEIADRRSLTYPDPSSVNTHIQRITNL